MKVHTLLIVFLIQETSSGEFACQFKDDDDFHKNSGKYLFISTMVHKCCNHGEYYHGATEQCVKYHEAKDVGERREFAYCLDPPMTDDVAYWVPPLLRSRQLLVIPNSFATKAFKNDITVQSTVIANNETVKRFLNITSDSDSFVTDVFKNDPPSYILYQHYCFEGTDNLQTPYIIRTWLIEKTLYKCCKKGEQLNRFLSLCVPRPHHLIEDTPLQQMKTTEDTELYWLPKPLRRLNIQIVYGKPWSHHMKGKVAFKIEDDSVVTVVPSKAFTLSLAIGNMSRPQRRELLEGFSCFDSVSEGPFSPRVLLSKGCAWNACVAKCCLPGEVLSESGLCVSAGGAAPPYASLTKTMSTDVIVDAVLPVQCLKNHFSTEELHHPNLIRNLSEVVPTNSSFYMKQAFPCVDWQHAEGGPRAVLGTCVLPPNAWLYERVRPLGALAAALLVVAAAVAVGRRATRRTAHGRALAAHALCLAAANALQVTWFFFREQYFGNCTPFAYPTYFFMVAANLWLCAILGNMIHGFRKPFQAARSFREDTCIRFTSMSAFAWGGSLLLTAVAVSVHQIHGDTDEPNFLQPTFAETKLCFIDDEGFYEFFRLGPLLYYYAPTLLMVLANSGGVAYVALTIRSLKKDESFLHAHHKHKSRLHSAHVYVKLLLMAGAVELALELASWCVRNADDYRSTDSLPFIVAEIHYSFTSATTFVDVLRAVSVLWLCAGWKLRVKRLWQQLCTRNTPGIHPQPSDSLSDKSFCSTSTTMTTKV